MKVVVVMLMVMAAGLTCVRCDPQNSDETGGISFRSSIPLSSGPHSFRPLGKDGRSFSTPISSSYSSLSSSYAVPPSSIASTSSYSSPTVISPNTIHSVPSQSTTFLDSSGELVSSRGFTQAGILSPPTRPYVAPSLPRAHSTLTTSTSGRVSLPSQKYGPPSLPSSSYGASSLSLRGASFDTSRENFAISARPISTSNTLSQPAHGLSRPVTVGFDNSLEHFAPAFGHSPSTGRLRPTVGFDTSFERLDPTTGFSTSVERLTPVTVHTEVTQGLKSPQVSPVTRFPARRPGSFDSSFERLPGRSPVLSPGVKIDDSSERFLMTTTSLVSPSTSSSYVPPPSSGYLPPRNPSVPKHDSREYKSSEVFFSSGGNIGVGGVNTASSANLVTASSENHPTISIGSYPNYQFRYEVSSPVKPSSYDGPFANHGHQERRTGKRTEGRYYVDLPDGRRQIVDYYADHTGYHPTITYV